MHMIFSLQRRLDEVAHPSGFAISMTATWSETPVFLRLYSRRSQNGMDLLEEWPLFQWWKESDSLGATHVVPDVARSTAISKKGLSRIEMSN